jgi:stress-induced morphogen
LQAGARLATFFCRQAKASLPPGETPEHFDMKSERQLARRALCCSALTCAPAGSAIVQAIAPIAAASAKNHACRIFISLSSLSRRPRAKLYHRRRRAVRWTFLRVNFPEGLPNSPAWAYRGPSRRRTMAMDAVEIERLIKEGIPDAQVSIKDLAGDGNHYAATVLAPSFSGKSRVQQHQLVYQALKGQMGGVLHALALQTGTP